MAIDARPQKNTRTFAHAIWLAVSTLLLLGLTARSADATTINFASFSQAGTNFNALGASVTQSGFTFSSSGGGFCNTLGVWEDSSPNHPTGGTSTTSLLEYCADATTTMVQFGNVAFDLNAIDLAEWGADQAGGAGTFTVTFSGTRADSSTVTQTFTVSNNSGSPNLQHFAFSGFTNIVSVSFVQGIFLSGTAYQFNNVVVNETTVPEPATYILVATGLLTLLGYRKNVRPSAGRL
jgi:hypothetical protein